MMPQVTIGTLVRDRNTKLTGRVVDIFPDVRPHVDLLAIRLDAPDPNYGEIICAFDHEVEVLDVKQPEAEV